MVPLGVVFGANTKLLKIGMISIFKADGKRLNRRSREPPNIAHLLTFDRR